MRVERAEALIGDVDAKFGGSVTRQGAYVGEALFARQKSCFGFFAIAVVLSCGGLLWKTRTTDCECACHVIANVELGIVFFCGVKAASFHAKRRERVFGAVWPCSDLDGAARAS